MAGRDEDVYAIKKTWSAGGQFAGLIADRKEDVLGLAYGQILAAWTTILTQGACDDLIRYNLQPVVCPSPFKGEVRRGMGCFDAEKPIPTPALPLKGRGFWAVAED